jgi:ClpP class serine protease
MTIAYPHVAERLFGHAHAIEPAALRAIVEGPVGRRVLSGARLEGKEAKKSGKMRRERLSMVVEAEPVRSNDGMAEFFLTAEGVAIMSVAGVLSRRYDWLAAMCGWTTYDALSASLDAAMADSRVKAILLDVESPGGEASGMLDIADKFLAARDVKPIWAVANSYAASAAYGIAGSASKLFLPRMAAVGSIGAVIVHVDQSAADQVDGLKYTAVFSGARKIDGWEHAQLSAQARDGYQARADHCRQSFADLIGRQGRMTSKQAMETEAGLYVDADAVTNGLADGVATFDEALANLTDLISKNSQSRMAARSTEGAASMSKENLVSTLSPAATEDVKPSGTEAVSEPVKAEPAAAAPAKPAPGETCSTCGQVMPGEDPADPDTKTTEASAGEYTVEMATETLELCAIAKLPAADAKAFVAAKTPVAGVRAALAKKAADDTDALPVHGTSKPAASSETETAAAWDKVVEEQNAKLAQNSKR